MQKYHSKRLNGAVRKLAFGAGFCALALDALLSSGQAQVQTVPGVDIQQLQQQYQPRNQAGDAQAQSLPQSVTIQPAVPAAPDSLPASRLEQIMGARAGVPLRQFGYDQLGAGRAVTVPLTGALQDDYVLGPGDEIVVSMRGQENGEFRVVVDRNGSVVLPRLQPISASGRTLGSFRADLSAALHRSYVATDASVSIGRVRQISVLVSGEVNQPGQRLVTGLSSAVDALLLSGGVRKTGSLRNIRISRNGSEYMVDLYNVLTDRGGSSSFRLADGDRILVPPLGPTVAVAGLVRTPGIFELPAHASGIPIRTLMALAGGQEVRGQYRLSVLRVLADGQTRMVAANAGETVRESEILFASLAADQTNGQVTLAGGSGLSGLYPVTNTTSLADILKAPGALGPSPYTLFGLLSRRDPRTFQRTVETFTPVAVMNGRENAILRGDDIVRIISADEARILVASVHSYVENKQRDDENLRNPLAAAGNLDAGNATPAVVPENGNASGTAPGKEVSTSSGAVNSQLAMRQMTDPVLANRATAAGVLNSVSDVAMGGSERTSSSANATTEHQVASAGQAAEAGHEALTISELAHELQVDSLVLLNFLVDHQAVLTGAVRGPGAYFIGPNVLLSDLVQAAGGTESWTDLSSVEMTSTAVDGASGRAVTERHQLPLADVEQSSYVVRPWDEFRFREAFTNTKIGSAVLQGEVRFPGTYPLIRGERLSELLARAGGLTNVAYPYGTVFLRQSVAQQEREGFQRAANEVENELVIAMTRVGNSRLDTNTFASMQSFVKELRTQRALGRISIIADPSALAARPGQDPLLEAGDVIFVPQRPSSVAVLGQVLQPGSFPYRPGENLESYIARAGGYAAAADESRTFVVLPDGTAKAIETSWLRLGAGDALPPGSTVVVPRDVTPLDLRQTIIDVSQIFSQFAVAIASVAVLSKQ